MEASTALSFSSSQSRPSFHLCNSSSHFKPLQIPTFLTKRTKSADFCRENRIYPRPSRLTAPLRPSFAVAEALEQASVSSSPLPRKKGTPSKVDKSGRFCSPRAARELALLIAYAACLDGSDPVRLFDKRVNAQRYAASLTIGIYEKGSLLSHSEFGQLRILIARNDFIHLISLVDLGPLQTLILPMINPGIVFDKASLLEYDHMNFGGPPIATETEEEAEELLRKYDRESAVEEDVLSAPPKLVYNKFMLRFARNILEAVVDRWDQHILLIDKITPPNWKNEPAGRILELCILHLAMAEITKIGTRHQIVINEAVDLAKRFCDGTAPRIINGCLRTFIKDLSAKESPQK